MSKQMKYLFAACVLVSAGCASPDVLWSSAETQTDGWSTYLVPMAADTWAAHGADGVLSVVSDCTVHSRGSAAFGGTPMTATPFDTSKVNEGATAFDGAAMSDVRYDPGTAYDAWWLTKVLTDASGECPISLTLTLGDTTVPVGKAGQVDLRDEHITALRQVVVGYGYDAAEGVIGIRGGWQIRSD